MNLHAAYLCCLITRSILLVCAGAATGEERWPTTFTALGGTVPGGEKGAVAVLDNKTGQPVWRSEGFIEEAQYPACHRSRPSLSA